MTTQDQRATDACIKQAAEVLRMIEQDMTPDIKQARIRRSAVELLGYLQDRRLLGAEISADELYASGMRAERAARSVA